MTQEQRTGERKNGPDAEPSSFLASQGCGIPSSFPIREEPPQPEGCWEVPGSQRQPGLREENELSLFLDPAPCSWRQWGPEGTAFWIPEWRDFIPQLLVSRLSRVGFFCPQPHPQQYALSALPVSSQTCFFSEHKTGSWQIRSKIDL